MRGKHLVAGIALAAVGFGAVATRVSADIGSDPNAEACAGQVVATLARDGAGGAVALKVKMTDLLISIIRPACDAGQSPESVIQKVREAIDNQ